MIDFVPRNDSIPGSLAPLVMLLVRRLPKTGGRLARFKIHDCIRSLLKFIFIIYLALNVLKAANKYLFRIKMEIN